MASKKRKPKKPRTVRAWGGFVDGELHWWHVHFGDDALTVFAVHTSKLEALKAYDDVRRVRIEVEP